MTTVFFTAAHGGFAGQRAPLGGGAAVYEHLVAEWERTRPFALRPLTSAILGAAAPRGTDLTGYNESRYAAFSRAFERAATEEILRHDPAACVVLANDISEGPDFARLAKHGYRIFTIFHVDVVDYVARLYFKGRVAPETTVRWYRRLRWATPDMAELVWSKQEAAVLGSRGLILPSERMRQVVLRCYPECAVEKIHVLPWGNWNSTGAEDSPQVAELRCELGMEREARVVLTLSRVSPEKGQDRLLESFLDWEQGGGTLAAPVWVAICGEAAFMQGKRHMEKLRELAARLRQVRVVFPGHVTGERKRAFFGLADVYAFPSRHESYGLTLMEAMAAGLPSVCCDTHGARCVSRPESGMIVDPHELAGAILGLLGDEERRKGMGEAARAVAEADPFAARASDLANILVADALAHRVP